MVITRLVQGVPSNRGSTDPSYANSPSLEEDVREGCRTKLRGETIVDNGRATGYLLRGTYCARVDLRLISRSPASGLLASADEELVVQVVSHLHPKDLLELSRSSRHLHSLLMTSGASPYWRVARRSIELPDAPQTINEAQYASLMFEQKCTVSMRRGCAIYSGFGAVVLNLFHP